MATLKQLETALVKAHNAGDTESARKLSIVVRKARADVSNLLPDGEADVAGTVPQQQTTLGENIVGAGETAVTMGSAMTTGAAGYVGGTVKGLAEQILQGNFGTQEAAQLVEQSAMEGMQAGTYSPRTQAGQEQTKAVGDFMAESVPALPLTAEFSGLSAATRAAAGVTAPIAKTAAEIGMASGKKLATSAIDKVKDIRAQSVAKKAAISDTSAGAMQTPDVMRRVAVAENLDVPVTLTKGAATRDTTQLEFEKGQIKSAEFGDPLRKRSEENNLQILQNMDAWFDHTGATTLDNPKFGKAVTKQLFKGLQATKNKVNVAYKAAMKSDETLAEVDIAKTVTIGKGDDQLSTSLIGYLNSKPSVGKTTAITDHIKKSMLNLGLVTKDENGNLIKSKPVNVREIEALRKEINEITGFDPVDVRQATILKNIIDTASEGTGGELMKRARFLRTQQARKYEKRAIVARLVSTVRGKDDPKVQANKVFEKTVLGSSAEELRFLKRVLQTTGKDGVQAWNEIQGATARYIKEQASGKNSATDSSGQPVVSPAKLHDVIRVLDQDNRLDTIFGKQRAGKIRDLNEVVKYVATVPPNTLINTSGTTMTIISAIAEVSASGAVFGIPVPVISMVKQLNKMKADKAMRKKINDSLNAMPVNQIKDLPSSTK